MGIDNDMSRRTLLVWALVLITIGVVGFGVTFMLAANAPQGGFSSNGQRIYYTGASAAGPIPRTVAGGRMMGFGMMDNMACVDCHGEDGRGGAIGMMFGALEIPDIRYSALTSSRSEDGTTVPAWTDGDIDRAIRDGIEPNGQRLKAPMPRWDMTDTEVADVISYLKELSAR
jgi:cytochrome c oxidase subunit 2